MLRIAHMHKLEYELGGMNMGILQTRKSNFNKINGKIPFGPIFHSARTNYP